MRIQLLLALACCIIMSASPSIARDASNEQFLKTLFNGKDYPVALSQSESYPWSVDYNSIKTSNTQDDAYSNCWFALDVFVPTDSASVTFDYQVRYHKEAYGYAKYANLTCTIDGEEVFSNNGTDNTESTTIRIAKGYHKLKWNLSLGEAWDNWDYFGKIENMRFDGISDESPLPEFSHLSIPFYNVGVNNRKKETVSITNAGNLPYTIESISNLNSPFSVIEGENQTIAPGETGYIAIEFEPQYNGYYDDELTISSNTGEAIIPVSGISTTGYVVISPIPGKLSSILKNTNCEDATIMGHLNRTDQYFLNKLQKCRYLNLAGTDIEIVTNGGINNLWKLQSIVLPRTLRILDTTWANNSTYEGKTLVTFYDLTCIECLSPNPPKVYEFYGSEGTYEEKPLGNLRPSTRLLVPEEHAANYSTNDIWSKLTLVPMTEDRTTLRVNLDVPNAENYSGMKLLLNNSDTRESSLLTLDGKKEYSFIGLQPYHLYNVALNEAISGRNMGSMDITDLDVPETFVTLSNIKSVHRFNGIVLDDQEKDVTSEVEFEWSDPEGNILSSSDSISGILPGDSIICSMTLKESLGHTYVNPQPIAFKAAPNDSTFKIHLTRISSVTIKGIVKNAIYKKPIENASILVSQYLNHKYVTETKASTDANGMYSLDLKNDSTLVSIVVQDYEPYKLGLTNLDEIHNLEEVLVQPNEGVTINITFTYQRKSESGTEPVVENWYNDYANVDFNVENKTTGKPICKKEYKWPALRLLENCAIGDSIAITVSSMNESFYPIEISCVVDSLGHAFTTIPIVEMGAINAEYAQSDNISTTGLLFDSNSKLIVSKPFISQKVSFDNLKDGRYTLVTMGTNNYYNSIPSLYSLSEYQLKEGTDYILNAVDVSQGIISKILCDSVPSFDTEAHRLTGQSTYFTVNKQSVVAGNYVTIDSKVDFVNSIKDRVKNVTLLIDLPPTVPFVKNSLMVGGNLSSNYKIEGNQLSIPLTKFDEKIRFCLQPSAYGTYTAGGSVRFSVDDSDYVQPIGTASFSASSITISAPHATPYKEITVGGNTLASAEVTLFDNSVAVGKTTASGSGKWQSKIALNNPYNHSHHQIYAKIETPDGIEMQSESKDVLYDKNQIVVSNVTMYHDNPEVGRTFSVVFDFLNPSPVTSSYTYYIYNKTFTFTIDLTDNNPEKVKDVVLWVTTGKGNEVGLDAKYDEAQGLWVASGQFGNMYDGDIPVNVAVSLTQEPIVEIDSNLLDENWNNYISYIQSLDESSGFYENLISRLDNEYSLENPSFENIKSIIDESNEYLGISFEHDTSTPNERTEQEFESFLELWGEEMITSLDSFPSTPNKVFGTYVTEWQGYQFSINVRDLTDSSNISTEGYTSFPTNMTKDAIFLKEEKNGISWIDIERNIALDVIVSLNLDDPRRANGQTFVNFDWDNFIKDIYSGSLREVANMALSYTYQGLIDHHIAQAKKASKMFLNLPKKYSLNRTYGHNLLQKHLTAAELLTKARRIFERVLKVGQLCANDINHIKILYEQLDMLENGLPKFKECAIEKYPDEVVAILYDIEALRRDFALCSVCKIWLQYADALASVFVVDNVVGNLIESTTTENWNTIKTYIGIINDYNSTCTDIPNQRYTDEGYFESHCPNAPNQIDPSGYVYETVPSNRLEGVKATCYQKIETENMYGDIIEKAVVWDARNFEQTNPVFTDKQGLYRWDVPEGSWQVKFEKEGYETTYTDWLPVPPPQLDINVDMVRYSQPNVAMAEWTENGIEICFDKYMLPTTINKNNIHVEFNGQDIFGDLAYVDEESANDNNGQSYVSAIRISPSITLGDNDVIDLTIKSNVKSYSGIPLGCDKSFSLSRVPTITDFICSEEIALNVNEQQIFHIQALAKDAAKGKTLRIANSSPLVCSIDDVMTLDENAEADAYLIGNIPGTATLTLSIDGYSRHKQISVVVSDVNVKKVATPYSSVEDSEPIMEGTEAYLFCDTEGATIYYTLDNSCPCDLTSRIKYDGTPIVLNQPTELRIMACKPGYEDSEVMVYNYNNVLSSIPSVSTTSEYNIYPKVTRDYVNLNLNGSIASRVAVWNIEGGLLQTKTNVPDGSRINLGNLPTGIYVIIVEIDGQKITEKVVKK